MWKIKPVLPQKPKQLGRGNENGLQKSLLHLCKLERFVPSIAAKGEGREDTESFAGNTCLWGAFWYSSSCLSLKTIGTCTQLFLTSKPFMVVVQTKKNVLVWVRTFIPQGKAAARTPGGCCFLAFWIPWIRNSKTVLCLWGQIAHFHARTFVNSDAVCGNGIDLQ